VIQTRCGLQTAGATIQRRDKGDDSGPLVGYASVFDSWTVLHRSKGWEVREVIRPGAFRNALAEGQDVRALYNHHPDNLLARTASGTLRLREDSKGLHVEFDPSEDELGRRVRGLISRGDLSQMSFAFIPRDGGEKLVIRRDGDLEVWETEITDVDLYDVAPVTYPAYKDTSIGMRAFTPAVDDRVKRSKDSWLREARSKSDALERRLAARPSRLSPK
jgi:HK97 family phage prohead protease